MLPGDRLLCAFVIQPKDASFTDWPLHITIIPWFRLDIASTELAEILDKKLSQITPFLVAMGNDMGFGHKGRKPVTLVTLPSPLTTIERLARQFLRQSGAWMVDETTKKRREFRPHVTVQQSGRLHAGDTFVCDTIYIVEQKGGHKEITGRIQL